MALRPKEKLKFCTKSRRTLKASVKCGERLVSGIRISRFGHCFKGRGTQTPVEPTSNQ